MIVATVSGVLLTAALAFDVWAFHRQAQDRFLRQSLLEAVLFRCRLVEPELERVAKAGDKFYTYWVYPQADGSRHSVSPARRVLSTKDFSYIPALTILRGHADA